MVDRLIIARHGNTFEAGETIRRIGARTDLSLTSTGITQALALGRDITAQGIVIDRIVSGPLRRTRQTAQYAAAAADYQKPLETMDWLVEIDHGPDEGRPESDVLRRLGQATLDAWNRYGEPPPGWRVDAAERQARWKALIEATSGTTLVVTSNGVARLAIVALGVVDAVYPHLGTGCYGIVDGGTVTVWNRRPAGP